MIYIANSLRHSFLTHTKSRMFYYTYTIVILYKK